ncbi:hypothetical protein TNCV_2601161 [Trichonephila clavipes]|nr:hypothetical protein TNCV_2601161 [Trichonephila clavipes]
MDPPYPGLASGSRKERLCDGSIRVPSNSPFGKSLGYHSRLFTTNPSEEEIAAMLDSIPTTVNAARCDLIAPSSAWSNYTPVIKLVPKTKSNYQTAWQLCL